jgi:uncharacterized membrane protein
MSLIDPLLKTLHLLGVIVWVGGMFFAHVCLRPSLAAIEPPQRIALMHAVLGRFFGAVVIASLAVLATGLAMMARTSPVTRPDVWPMLGIGVVMLLIFGWVRMALFPRFAAAARGGSPAEAAARLAPIRHWVGVNLILGIAVVAIVAMV